MERIDCDGLFKSQTRRLLSAKAFTPLAKTKMITRPGPGRAETRAFVGGVVYSLISVLPNEFLFKAPYKTSKFSLTNFP